MLAKTQNLQTASLSSVDLALTFGDFDFSFHILSEVVRQKEWVSAERLTRPKVIPVSCLGITLFVKHKGTKSSMTSLIMEESLLLSSVLGSSSTDVTSGLKF